MFVYLFVINGLGVPIFGVCVAIAVVGAVELFKWSSREFIAAARAESLAVWTILAGLVGAKLWYEFFYSPEPFRDFFSPSGIVFHGGFISGAFTFFVLSYIQGFNLRALADSAALAVLFGYGVGRLGCQLSGDGDYGIPTDSVFGMPYPSGVVPVTVPVYPTPFFETSFTLLGLALIIKNFRRANVGKLLYCWTVLLIMGLERFFIEFIRLNPRVSFGLTEAQFISLGILAIGLLGMLNQVKYRRV